MNHSEQALVGAIALRQQSVAEVKPRAKSRTQRTLPAATPALTSEPGAELTVVVPTLNECENVPELVRRLDTALADFSWEVIFVDDDSRDGTADCVRSIGLANRRVRCLHRINRRGLSTACIEGMLASTAPYLAVIDADLQHDEALLPRMLESLKNDDVDIVIGSRHIEGAGLGDWHQHRVRMSRFATAISRSVLHAELSDPMSGMFMVKRSVLQQRVHALSGIGFKILLDLFASGDTPLRYKELPYQFRNRQFGASKLDSRVAWDFLMLLLDKRIGHIVPPRFVTFMLVGTFGVLIHLATLLLLFKGLQLGFTPAQAGATLMATTCNFTLNNVLTYRDLRLRGWQWLRGWLSFATACSIGAVANVGIASYLFQSRTSWWLAAVAGVMVGAVWNYALTSAYTWKNK